MTISVRVEPNWPYVGPRPVQDETRAMVLDERGWAREQYEEAIAQGLVFNLERKGYIRRYYNESRSIEVLPPRGTSAASEIPLLGKVAAGTPIESLMHQETIAVPDQMLPRRGPNYALRVQGTSMIDEHIVDGDVVVVHGKQSAENGEMVIALVNGSEATVKKFYREAGGWIRLKPANATMQPMRFQERDVLIQGVVVGVIRKY